MEYLAYAHMVIVNTEADPNTEFSLPESNLKLSGKKSFQSAWLNFASFGVLFAILAQAQAASAFTKYYVRTNGGCLQIRTNASSSAPVVGCLKNGAAVSPILAYRNGFAKLQNGRYVSAQYISTTAGSGNRPGLGVGGQVTLSPGDRGAAVAQVQKALRIPVTNYYDRNTFNAVVNFQRINGLQVDGLVGPETKTYLLG